MTAIPKLLDMIDIQACTTFIDALLMSKHAQPDDEHMDVDAGHGRVEKRRSRIYRDTAYISQFRPGASEGGEFLVKR